MKKIAIPLLSVALLLLPLASFAQTVPDDPKTAMTFESSQPIGSNDPANNDNVPGDPNFTMPDNPETGGNYEGPVGVTGIFNGNVATGCSYDPLGHSASRVVDDIVVPGSIGKYPLKMTRYYNTRQQYYGGGAIGLGPGWAHEYSWIQGSGNRLVSPHGNVYDPLCGAPVGVSESWEGNDWRLADGGRVHFDTTTGRCTWIEDPYRQRTTISYSNNQISQVTEPGGRYLKFIYGPAADPDGTVLLTRVEAHGLGNATITNWVDYGYTLVSAGVEGRDKRMLTQAAYSDGTSAAYEYRTDNVTESPTTHKMYPLLQRCDDVRYNGPMRTIRYEYQNGGPHGAIINEKYPGAGEISAISVNGPDTFTETRGDGPTRSFTYTHMFHCQGPECEPCDNVANSNPPQQMMTSYTDFQARVTQIGYDANWYINSVRDANNHTSTYTRGPAPPNGIGQITRVTHPGGAHMDYSYCNEGSGNIGGHYLCTVSDERGNATIYNRDGNYRVTSIDYKDNQNTVLAHEEFVYNNFGQVTRHKLKNGNYVHYQYDGRGLLTAKWNPTSNATAVPGDPKVTYAYYTGWCWADRVSIETLPANTSNQVAFETYEYDRNASSQGCNGRGLITKITHADGKFRSFGYSQFGNKLWEENELLQRTTYTYDNYNRVLSVINPLNKTETFDYLKPGTASSYLHNTDSVYTHTSRAGIATKNVYDQNWRKISTTAAFGTVAAATTSFDYDNVGNLTRVTDPLGRQSQNAYDNRNRKTSTTDAYGTNLATTTVWHYDAVGNINQIDRPDGEHETKGYDGLNRMSWYNVRRQIPGTNNYENLLTRYGYNPSGTILWVKNPKQDGGAPSAGTYFEYNASDERTKMVYPGLTQQQQWTYDNAHNLASRVTVNGETQSFTYDKRNRKTGMSWSNGADPATYGYDDTGRLLTATNPNSTITRAYDAAGRQTQDQQNVTGLGTKTITYPSYDDDGRTKQISLTGVYDYTFGYDPMGRLETISTGGSLAFRYAYDSVSNQTHRYSYLPNSVTLDQVYGRDSLNRMANRFLKKNGQSFSQEVYTYDRMNRLTQTVRDDGKKDIFGFYWNGDLCWAQYGAQQEAPIQEGADPDMDTTDPADPYANYQPPDVTEPEPVPPDGSGNPPPPVGFNAPDSGLYDRWVGYLLDKAGNRTVVADSESGNMSYNVNDLNQYTSAAGGAVTNGNNHEIGSYSGVTYTYINDERLKQVSSGVNNYYLYYDALGRCVQRKLNGVTTYYIYDGEKPILDYKSTDLTHPAKNVYGKGIDEILMRIDPTVNSGNPFYYQQDHEGSVTHLLNTSGNPIESYRYDAFGAPTFYKADGTQIASTAYNNRFLFTGREYAATYQKTYTAAFGFYEYRARAYNPTLGRFMSEDPKGFDAGDYNLFRYCHNDPLDFADPMGLDAISFNDRFNYFIQSPALDRNFLRGSFINVISRPSLSQQCAKGAQFMAGTMQRDGLHGVPTTHNPVTGNPQWFQGPPVGPNTNGMLVARGFVNGVYPSLSPKQTEPGQIINHSAIQTGFDATGRVHVFDQWKGQSMGDRSYDAKREGWYVVLVPKDAGQYAKRPNDLVPTAQANPSNAHQVDEEATEKKAFDLLSNLLHAVSRRER